MTDKAQGDIPKDPKRVSTTLLREERVPEELTGRATRTGDDLTALFKNDSADHLADGFSGGSDDDVGVALQGDGDSGSEPQPKKSSNA